MRRLSTASLLLTVGMAANVMAFHDGGAAKCNGCHTMHNSENGVLVDPNSPNGNPYLLKDATPSDVCLGCHGTSRGALLGGTPTAPTATKGGGNFIFLQSLNLNDGRGGATNPISGDAAGHNLNAPGYGLAADATLTASPGGNYPAGSMGCTSCHDPHGTADFRLLYGAGRVVLQGNHTFVNPAPVAIGLSTGSTGGTESGGNHTAYQSGMSAWCGNCHGNFHNEAGGRLEHPSGSNLGSTIANNYNLYNGTANLNGGSEATAYLAEVPFEDAANTIASTTGPTASSQVMCLSCHRAHASSAPNAGRWDFNITLFSEDGVESGSYAQVNPYANPNQRSLCNKCHVKDAYDHSGP